MKFAEINAALADAVALKAEADARKAGIPPTENDYKLALPEGVALPEGFALDESDPRLPELRKLAHEEGMTQAQFNKFIQLDLQAKLQHQAKITEAIKARDTALGTNGTARVDALVQWFGATADDPAIAKQLAATLWTPGIIQHFEKLQSQLGTQGVGGAGRAATPGGAPEPGKIPGYEKMSFDQRRAAQMNMG